MEIKKINIHNYEEYIINYLDGNMTPVEVAELFLFFENHPEIDENIHDLRMMKVKADNENAFGFNNALKIDHDADGLEISPENYIYYFTAYLEGDLSEKGNESVEHFIQKHPETKNELELLKQTKVQPPLNVIFPQKSGLKRKSTLIMPARIQWAAIAATLLILFSVYLRLKPESEESLIKTIIGDEMTITETPVKQQEKEQQKEEKTNTTNHISKDQLEVKTNLPEKTKNSQPKSQESREEVKPIRRLPAHKPTINHAQPFEAKKRDEYTSLYEDIRLSQELMLAYAENQEQFTNDYEGLQLINLGRRFNHYVRSGAQVANQVSGSMGGWLLADLSIKGFNLLTNNELKLVREVNPDGSTGNVSIGDDEASYLLRKSAL
ncbi:MAG: hypothetical protein K0B15_00460 [Lentimicrobium sp.]|nr:hypothetical protein [Lentimicrobium sp.]